MPKSKVTPRAIRAIESKATLLSQTIQNVNNVENTVNAAIASSLTVVLGDHKSLGLLKTICKNLKKKKIPNTLVKLVPSNVNAILKSKLIMRDATFIIMVDGTGPGTVGEAHYAIANELICSKVHLFIRRKHEKKVWDQNNYYLFFPRFSFWGPKRELFDLAVKITDKELRRLAYLEILKETQCWGCKHLPTRPPTLSLSQRNNNKGKRLLIRGAI